MSWPFVPPLIPPVLAQSSRWVTGRSSDSELFGINTQGLIGLGVAAAVLGVVAVVYYLLKNRPRPKINDPAHLFRELCDSHQLGRRHRELIARFAKQHKLSNPCMLFVDSSLWFTGSIVKGADGKANPDAQKLDQLKKTLFSPAKSKPSAG